jgi:DnaJ-class molecular chaperone
MSIKKNEHPWDHKFKKPLEKYRDCKKCKGTGQTRWLLILSEKCVECRGSGKVRNLY